MSEEQETYNIAQAQAIIAQQKASIEKKAADDFPTFCDAHNVDLVLSPTFTTDGRVGVSARFVAR